MDDKTYWQVVGSVITAAVGLFGVLLGGFLAHLWTQQRSDREFRIRKLEELYRLMVAYGSDMYSLNGGYTSLCNGATSCEDLLRKNEPISKHAGEKWSEILGMVMVLFEELKPAFESWQAVRPPIAMLQAQILQSSGNLKDFLPRYHELRTEERIMREQFMKRICFVADEIRAGGVGVWLSHFNR